MRVRGDKPQSLREQFLTGLEKSLGEHQATRGSELPFWYASAEKALGKLSVDDRRRADDFLEQHHMDVALLLREVQKRRDVYQYCIDLFTYLHDMAPNLGGEVALDQTVMWAVDTFCGDGKPLGGLLVLFDEFTPYVQRYAQRGPTGDLQDLLNGIDLRRGKSVFLAFALYDPMSVVDAAHTSATTRTNLRHELTRLPDSGKFALYSLMESVIGAYLHQSPEAWNAFGQTDNVLTKLLVAGDVAVEPFRERYENTLRWGYEQFRERVTIGCFPLHPLTTAFLCNIRLSGQEVGAPRTVLGFVLEELNARKDQPAMIDERINWIMPVDLVDYFEARVAGEAFKAYENAVRLAGGSASQEQLQLLKALLLQQVAGLAATGQEQIRFLAQAAGMGSASAEQALRALAITAKAIRSDMVRKAYVFWSIADASPDDLEMIISKQLEDQAFDEQAMGELNTELSRLPAVSFGSAPVRVAWGESDDWAAHEVIVTREFFTKEYLRGVVRPYTFTGKDLLESPRGAVIWLLALNEDDVAWYRAEANRALDEAFPGEAPLPVVCIVGSEPYPELINAFQRWSVLKGLKAEDRKRIGEALYGDEVAFSREALIDAVEELRGGAANLYEIARAGATYVVPFAYRARVHGLPNLGLNNVLRECYRLAYRYSPPEFFDQYKMSQAVLRSATKRVATMLLQKPGASIRSSLTEKTDRDLCERFLYLKWHLLTADYRVQEPSDQHVAKAWQLLEDTFVPGQTEVMAWKALIPLLNPPYGYDYNTATLVFCAWFSWHAHDLKVSAQSAIVSQDSLVLWLDKGGRDFFGQLCLTRSAAILRRVPGEATREVKALIARVKSATLTQQEAGEAIVKLNAYGRDPRSDAGVVAETKQTADAVEEALEMAHDYENQVRKIEQPATAEQDPEKLIALLGAIGKLPRLGNVLTTASQPDALRESVLARLQYVVEAQCQRNENLRNRTELALNRANLYRLRTQLQKIGLPNLTARVDEATHRLEQKGKALELQEQENALRRMIEVMDLGARLKTLYEYREQSGSISGASASLQELRDKKLEAIEGKIAGLEKQAEELETKLAQVSDQNALEAWLTQALRVASQYADTLYQDRLERSTARAERLRAYFSELNQTQNAASATPEEFDAADQQISRLLEHYADVIGAPQRTAAQSARTALQARVQQKRRAALAQLRDLDYKFRSGIALPELKARLDNSPVFLPAEDALRWRALRDRVEARIEEEAQEKAIRNQINAMDVNARLAMLYEYRQRLQAMDGSSGQLQQLRDRKSAAVEGKIAELEKQADELESSLGQVGSQNALEAWRTRVLRIANQYGDTQYQERVERVTIRSERLRALLSDLSVAQSVAGASPEEFEAADLQLSQLVERFADTVGETQRTAVEDARKALQLRLQQKRQIAAGQLSELQEKLQTGTALAQLKARLDNPPVFLPVGDIPRWQALRDQVQARMDQEVQAQAIRNQINAMDLNARLATLYGYCEPLRAMTECSGQVGQLRDKQLTAIEAKIGVLEKQAGELESSLAQTNSQGALEAWRGRALKVSNLYDETPFQAQLDRATARAERLRAFFAELAQTQNVTGSSPAEFDAAEQGIAQLSERYADVMGKAQQVLAASKCDELRRRLESLRASATEQLRACEADFQAGHSRVELKTRLEQTPAFLPAAELPRWHAMQCRVQEEIDLDMVAQIELQFRKIKDPGQREACLRRLQQIVTEWSAAQPVEGGNHV